VDRYLVVGTDEGSSGVNPEVSFLMRAAIGLKAKRCAKRKPPGFTPVDRYLFQLEKRLARPTKTTRLYAGGLLSCSWDG